MEQNSRKPDAKRKKKPSNSKPPKKETAIPGEEATTTKGVPAHEKEDEAKKIESPNVPSEEYKSYGTQETAAESAGPSTSTQTVFTRTYPCDVCETEFFTSSSLRSHKEMFHPEERFACNVCPKVFPRLGHLQIHQRIHTGEKPFSCEKCVRKFTTVYLLNRHEKTHTREKSFLCDECGKLFTEKYNLARHKQTHADDKLFLCDICGDRFNTSGGMKKHRSSHTGTPPRITETDTSTLEEKLTETGSTSQLVDTLIFPYQPIFIIIPESEYSAASLYIDKSCVQDWVISDARGKGVYCRKCYIRFSTADVVLKTFRKRIKVRDQDASGSGTKYKSIFSCLHCTLINEKGFIDDHIMEVIKCGKLLCNKCKESSSTKKMTEESSSSIYTPLSVHCRTCGEDLCSELDMQSFLHSRSSDSSGEETIVCLVCRKQNESLTPEFQAHLLDHVFPGNICCIKCYSEIENIKDVLRVSAPGTLTEAASATEISKYINVKEMEDIEGSKTEIYICKICNDPFTTEEEITIHVKDHTEKEEELILLSKE